MAGIINKADQCDFSWFLTKFLGDGLPSLNMWRTIGFFKKCFKSDLTFNLFTNIWVSLSFYVKPTAFKLNNLVYHPTNKIHFNLKKTHSLTKQTTTISTILLL